MLPACVTMLQECYRRALGTREAFARIWNERKFNSLPAMEPEALKAVDKQAFASELDYGIRNLEREDSALSRGIVWSLGLYQDLLEASSVFYWCGAFYVVMVVDEVLRGFYVEKRVLQAVRLGAVTHKALHVFARREGIYLMILSDAYKEEEFEDARFSLFRN